MAIEIPVQDMPANGGSLDDLVFTAADTAGHFFKSDPQVLLIVRGASVPGGDVVVEAVAALDSGRDVTSTITVPADGINMAGPFKPRNFKQAGNVNITISSATDIELACVRARPALNG